MAEFNETLNAHLAGGITTLCRAWLITRRDGVIHAFTDHDLPLEFDGITFRADSGLSARAIAQSTGLSVDNTETIGALSDASIREDEIEQGRFDSAAVQAWLVNWSDLSMRWLQFRGKIGELHRVDGAFRAELRGLTEALNRPLGRVYQKPCTAVLGDKTCRFAVETDGYSHDLAVASHTRGQEFRWTDFLGFDEGWFARGRMEVLAGPAKGLWSVIKNDQTRSGERVIELWEPIRGSLEADTPIRLIAGCDKRLETCRLKFNNLVNFQGFPDLPAEDWVMSVPRSSSANSGGSRR